MCVNLCVYKDRKIKVSRDGCINVDIGGDLKHMSITNGAQTEQLDYAMNK